MNRFSKWYESSKGISPEQSNQHCAQGEIRQGSHASGKPCVERLTHQTRTEALQNTTQLLHTISDTTAGTYHVSDIVPRAIANSDSANTCWHQGWLFGTEVSIKSCSLPRKLSWLDGVEGTSRALEHISGKEKNFHSSKGGNDCICICIFLTRWGEGGRSRAWLQLKVSCHAFASPT